MLQTAVTGDIQRHVLLLFALGVLQEEKQAGDRHVFLVRCSRRTTDWEVRAWDRDECVKRATEMCFPLVFFEYPSKIGRYMV